MTTNLNFTWYGDADGKDTAVMTLTVGGHVFDNLSVQDGFTIDIPITERYAEIKVQVAKAPGKSQSTCIKHIFEFELGKNYECKLSGSMKKGFCLQMSDGDGYVTDDTPKLRNSLQVGFTSFLFPIYGIIQAIISKYNRVGYIGGAVAGFLLATIFSASADSDEEIGLGFGSHTLIEYEPFSFLDHLVNILIGGCASLLGLIRALVIGLLENG